MNVAVIFAGGTGRRMHTGARPKQFLTLHGKPVLVHTLEHFQNHAEIDGIILVCLAQWLNHCAGLQKEYALSKIVSVLPGGQSGQASIRAGVQKARQLYPEDTVLLVHDGVRPLIDGKTITDAIACTRAHGSAVTVSPVEETVTTVTPECCIRAVVDRGTCRLARAPQCFYLGELFAAHERALADGNLDFIDSASLMLHYGHKLYTVTGPAENIKITTPADFYFFRAIMDARENSQTVDL